MILVIDIQNKLSNLKIEKKSIGIKIILIKFEIYESRYNF